MSRGVEGGPWAGGVGPGDVGTSHPLVPVLHGLAPGRPEPSPLAFRESCLKTGSAERVCQGEPPPSPLLSDIFLRPPLS